jgi:hypothetical protein
MADRGWAPRRSLFLALGIASMAFACSGSDSGDNGGGGTGSITIGKGGATSASSGGATSNGSSGGAIGSGSTTSTVTACSDGVDNDGDGAIDGFDSECTGAADNDEGTYATGIPGDNRDPKWQDCFFDGNSGAGDDHCRYATGCLTGELTDTDPSCALTDDCVEFCRPLTPNGCDCFGCCTIQLENGSSVDVTLSSTCSVQNAGDSKACPRCTKTTQCENTCGECELCAGKTLADLPASCMMTPTDGDPPPPTHTCDGGEQICGPDLPPCEGTSSYCSFGCCMPIVR